MEARGRWVRRRCNSNGIRNRARNRETGAALHIARGHGAGRWGGTSFSSRGQGGGGAGEWGGGGGGGKDTISHP